jgi:signal transduction histidine kinase
VVRRSLRSWPDTAGSRLTYVVGGIAVFGMWSEHVAVGLGDWRGWIVDAAVGFALLASGVVAHRRAPHVGLLLLVSAAAWWLGNVGAGMLFLHRGVLALAVWTYPHGRIRGRGGAVAVVAGSLLAVPTLARSDAGTAAFGVVVLAGALVRFGSPTGGRRRFGRVALQAAAVIALGSVGAAVLRHGVAEAVGPDVATLWYHAAIAGAAVMLAQGVQTRPSGAIADAVVELAAGPRRQLRDRLADLLDDPELVVARRADDGWVDDLGRAIAGSDVSGRVLTVVPGLATPIAIVHDASLASDPALLEALASVTRLATRNAELDLATQRLLDDLVASRRRLLDAEDEERRRLSRRLHSGVGQRLDAVEAHLVAGASAVDDRSVGDAIQRARNQLDRTRDDLVVIAQGLHPGDPGGHLVDALSSLVGGSPVPAELRAPDRPQDSVSARVGVALSYCCAEALANAVKHAAATRIVVELSFDGGAVRLVVTDDGIGGADVASGTGLRGLRDRVEALGGALRLESAPGAGTRLTVTLPSEPAALAVAGEARS